VRSLPRLRHAAWTQMEEHIRAYAASSTPNPEAMAEAMGVMERASAERERMKMAGGGKDLQEVWLPASPAPHRRVPWRHDSRPHAQFLLAVRKPTELKQIQRALMLSKRSEYACPIGTVLYRTL
jgi:hypothetical protein